MAGYAMMSRTNWTARVVGELATVAAAMAACQWVGWPAVYPAAVLIGTRVHALLILGHIGAHRGHGYGHAVGDFLTRWVAMGPTGMDLRRYRSLHTKHHAWIGEQGRDPEIEIVTKFARRWEHYRPSDTVKDLLGLHADETRALVEALATPRSYVVPAAILLAALWLAPWGAAAFVLSPFVGAITVHRLRAWTEHDHIKFPGYTYTMAKPRLWRRWLYLPHGQWEHAQHHGGLKMPKPFAFP